MSKNLFLTFCFSFIPGAGQMYQEYMKRGLSIMIMFIAFCAMSIMIGTPIFVLPLPVILAYSFFDTYNIRNSIARGEILEDEYIWKNTDISFLNINIEILKRNAILGIILILFGLYLLVDNVFIDIARVYDIEWLGYFLTYFLRYIPPILIASISIVMGFKFISKGKE